MSDLNLVSLEKTFNIKSVEEDSESLSLEGVTNRIEEIISDISLDKDPDNILLRNIERATALLDETETQISSGNFSSRLLEVSSQLIDSVTKAAAEIRSSQQQELYLRLRDEMLQLNKVKMVLEAKKGLNKSEKKDGGNKREIIVTDRETILKMLEDKENE